MAGDTYCEGDAQNRQCNGQRVVDCGFQTDWVKPRTIQFNLLFFFAKLLDIFIVISKVKWSFP
jgi:hypothetical protein